MPSPLDNQEQGKKWGSLMHLLHVDAKGRTQQQRRKGAAATMQLEPALVVTQAVRSHAQGGPTPGANTLASYSSVGAMAAVVAMNAANGMPRGNLTAGNGDGSAGGEGSSPGDEDGQANPSGATSGSTSSSGEPNAAQTEGDDTHAPGAATPVQISGALPRIGGGEASKRHSQEGSAEDKRSDAAAAAAEKWSKGDWLMIAKAMEISVGGDVSPGAELSDSDSAHARSLLTQLLETAQEQFATAGDMVRKWQGADWTVIVRCLEVSTSPFVNASSTLSMGEKAHGKALMDQLIGCTGTVSLNSRDSEQLSGFGSRSAMSSSSSEAGDGDLAAEWARQLELGNAPGSPGSTTSSGGASKASAGMGLSSVAGSGLSTVGAAADVEEAPGGEVDMETLESAALNAIMMCPNDKTANGCKVFNSLLDKALNATGSTMGFISSINFRPSGAAYLKTHAMTNVAWTPQLHAFFEEKKDTGLIFSNLDTLVGAIAKSGRLVLTNSPDKDPRSSGVPPGHPKIRAFMGMPLYLHGRPVGAIAVANRSGGYSEAMAAQMTPFNEVVAELLGRYLISAHSQEPAAPKEGSPTQFARDAFLSFSSSGILSTMNKAAEAIFGHRTGDHIAAVFSQLGGGDVEISASGLEKMAAAAWKVRAVGLKRNGQPGQFEILVTRGFSQSSQFVVSLWEAAAGAPQGAARPQQQQQQVQQPQRSVSRRGGPDAAGMGAECPVSTRKPPGMGAECPVSRKQDSKKLAMQAAGAAFRAYEMSEADQTPNGSVVAKFLLSNLLQLTGSGMGLISSIHQRPNGAPYLRTHAMTNVAWTPELKQWYDENWERGLIFSNMNSLVGAVVSPPYEPIIANEALKDARSTGVPPGHFFIKSYMGVPLFHGGELIGMWAVCNSRGKFNKALLSSLEPLTKAASDILGKILGHVAEEEEEDDDDDNGEDTRGGDDHLLDLGVAAAGNGKAPSFPAEWMSDAGPMACPYLGGPKAGKSDGLEYFQS